MSVWLWCVTDNVIYLYYNKSMKNKTTILFLLPSIATTSSNCNVSVITLQLGKVIPFLVYCIASL